MKRNRILTLALMALTCLTLLAGCGGSDPIIFSDLYAELAQVDLFPDSNMQKAQNALEQFYYIDEADLNNGNYLIYMSDYSTGKADEVAMFEVADESKVVTIQALLDDRLNDLRVSFEDYQPDEVPKIDNAVIKTKGNYIVMVISGDPEKAQEVLDQFM